MSDIMGGPRFARRAEPRKRPDEGAAPIIPQAPTNGANGADAVHHASNGNGAHATNEAHGAEARGAAARPKRPTPPRDEALRDRLGRFRPGHAGGPGNPYGRQVALLRRVILDTVNPEKMQALVDVMYDKAMDGDHFMMKLLTSYLVGQPAAAENPDRVEHQEWAMRLEQPYLKDVEEQRDYRYPHNVANVLCNAADHGKAERTLQAFDIVTEAKEKEKQKQAERAERRKRKKEERQRRGGG